jgi:hypothetical protein
MGVFGTVRVGVVVGSCSADVVVGGAPILDVPPQAANTNTQSKIITRLMVRCLNVALLCPLTSGATDVF